MSLVKDAIKKFGFANTLSVISLVISITCFAFVARISQRYAKIELNKTKPRVIVANNEQIKVAVDKNNYDIDSAVYDNIVHDIDKISDNRSTVKQQEKVEVIEKKPKITTQVETTENIEGEVIKKQQEEEKSTLQIGIFNSHREAVAAWFKTADKIPELSNAKYNIISQQNPDKKYIFLLQIKSKNTKEAKDFTKLLKDKGIKAMLI